MRKIRVLHTEWSDGWGGQEIRIINEMLAVREHGVEVYLACRENSKIKEKAIENNIKVFTLPFRGNTDFKTLFALVGIIKKNHINIVNTHSGKDTWVGGVAAKIAGIKFIRTRHLGNRINPSRLNFINEIADYVITTGQNVRKDMIKYNRVKENRILSIPSGSDEKIFKKENYDEDFLKNKYNLNDEILIGALGVVRSVKGYEFFLEAAEILVKEFSNIRFFIAGDGPLLKEFQEAIRNKSLENTFYMLGHIDEVAEYINSLDIFINCSKSEGVSQAIIQALMMNKAVIATDVGSTRDLYNESNFLLCESSNSIDLSAKIRILIENKKLREELSIKSRDYIIDNFSKKAMQIRILSIYKNLFEDTKNVV